MPNVNPRPANPGAKRFLVPALFVAGFVCLGLVGVGGTLAYLTASTSVPGSTVRSGTLALDINGAPSVDLGAWNPTPSLPDARSFTVTNTGDAPADVSPEVDVTSTAQIRNFTQLRLEPVANAADCHRGLSGGLAGPIMLFPTDGSVRLGPAETATICAIVSLDPTVPIGRSGESVAFTMTLTAIQAVN